jgi:hypothetical protein
MTHLQTVVELDSFLRRAKAIMSDDERMGIVTFLAANPEAGVSLGGGLRKVRVPVAARVADIEQSMCLVERICRSSC